MEKNPKTNEIQIDPLRSQLNEIDELRILLADLAARKLLYEFGRNTETHGLLVAIRRKANAFYNSVLKTQREICLSEVDFKNSSHASFLLLHFCPLLKTCQLIEEQFGSVGIVELESSVADLTRIFSQIYALLANEEIAIDPESATDDQPSTEIHSKNWLETRDIQDSSHDDPLIFSNRPPSKRNRRKKTILMTAAVASLLFGSVCVIMWFSKSIFGWK